MHTTLDNFEENVKIRYRAYASEIDNNFTRKIVEEIHEMMDKANVANLDGAEPTVANLSFRVAYLIAYSQALADILDEREKETN